MKNVFRFYGESNLAPKAVIGLFALGVALIFSSDKKSSSKKKKHGFVERTKKAYRTTDAVVNAFYLHDLKKRAANDDFPVKLEQAVIIDI